MYPLVVSRGIGKLIDLLLGDGVPVAVAQMRTDRAMHLIEGKCVHVTGSDAAHDFEEDVGDGGVGGVEHLDTGAPEDVALVHDWAQM